jgi:uncharacterized cupredoxin-like copper-binding protein/cytochrome c2
MRKGGVQGTLAARVPRRARGFLAFTGCVSVAALAGCGGVTSGQANLVNGKEKFIAKCGACHTLGRAGTKGITGPNLDEAFQRARIDGERDSTFAGVVSDQIAEPNRIVQVDPQTLKPLALMPANLVTGEDRGDVAAYVGMVAGRGGKDSGQLASVGAKPKGIAKAKGGILDIPVNSAGGLAYQFAGAEAPAGKLTVESKNAEPIGHNIAVEGNGVNQQGPVVQGGGISKISVDLKPGSYTFYCSVPGHRQGGMVGKLTVK